MEKPADISCERLLNLRYYLRYELFSSFLYPLIYFSGIYLSGLLLMILVVLAILFAPYMLTILFKEKRYGWITFFFISVIVPMIMIFILPFNRDYLIFLEFIPFGFFYLFCFLLKLTIDDWIAEKRGYIERKYRVKPIEKFEDLWSKR